MPKVEPRTRHAAAFVATCAITALIPESDPESWPQYVLDWDEDGAPHLIDIDVSIEWDGWRIAGFEDLRNEFDQVEGGGL